MTQIAIDQLAKRLGVNLCLRLSVCVQDERCAQGLVATDQLIQTPVQQRCLQRAVQLKGQRDGVGRAGRLELIQKIQSLLSVRQRLTVLRR